MKRGKNDVYDKTQRKNRNRERKENKIVPAVAKDLEMKRKEQKEG